MRQQQQPQQQQQQQQQQQAGSVPPPPPPSTPGVFAVGGESWQAHGGTSPESMAARLRQQGESMAAMQKQVEQLQRQLAAKHPFPEVAPGERLRRRKLLTIAPGDATGRDQLPSHTHLFVSDMDGNGRKDLVTHSPGQSAGDCAMRCHQQERFGYASFDLRDADDSTREGSPYCLCGPKFESMLAPT